MGSGTGHQCTAGQVCVVTQCFCSISLPQFLFLPISLTRVHKHTCMNTLTLPFSDLPGGSLGRCVSLNNTIRKLLLPQDMNFTPHNPSHSHTHTHMHTHIFCHSLSVLVSNVNYTCYIILQQEATNFYTPEYKQQQYYF